MYDDFFDFEDEREQESNHEEFTEALILRDIVGKITGSYLLTNVEVKEKDLILQAARETAYNIYVEDEAFAGMYDEHSSMKPLKGLVGVWTRDMGKDHGPFWNRFRELEAAKKAKE